METRRQIAVMSSIFYTHKRINMSEHRAQANQFVVGPMMIRCCVQCVLVECSVHNIRVAKSAVLARTSAHTSFGICIEWRRLFALPFTFHYVPIFTWTTALHTAYMWAHVCVCVYSAAGAIWNERCTWTLNMIKTQQLRSIEHAIRLSSNGSDNAYITYFDVCVCVRCVCMYVACGVITYVRCETWYPSIYLSFWTGARHIASRIVL